MKEADPETLGSAEFPPPQEERTPHRLPHPKSESSPPTPAASSAGASSPALPANIGSIDWCGSGKGQKGSSFSRNGSKPSWVAGGSASNAGGSTQGASQPSCRPWDRGDLLRRLATFKSSNWSPGKPKVAGVVACARRGWVNVDVDVIACEACGLRLTFLIPASWSQHKVEEAANNFSEQLDSAHTSFCPWKGNPCAESLVQFPLPQFSALVESYYDRCDTLLQLSTLPVIAGCAIGQMKLTKGPKVDWLLSQPPLLLGREPGWSRGKMPWTEALMPSANDSYCQAQCLISLCGWEPRFISNIPDCEEHSAHSAQNGRSTGFGKRPKHKILDPGPSLFPRSRASKPEKKTSGQSIIMVSESKASLASVVLDCNLCGASVALSDFVSCQRTIPSSGSTLVEISEPGVKVSGIDLWGVGPSKLEQEVGDGVGDGVVTGEKRISGYGALDLNLTIAGGLPPTVLGSDMAPPSASELGRDSQLCLGQPEGGSEVGFPAASYESFGPCTRGNRPDDGGSTVERPQSRACHGDSVEGTIVDAEGDELASNRGRSCVGESSRSKRSREILGVDQLTDPGCSYLIPFEADTDWAKRAKSELPGKESYELRLWSPKPNRDSVYASSVIAVDTSYGKDESSMESVENAPQESDGVGTAMSPDKSGRTDMEEALNLLDQAQQSTCQPAGPSEQVLSTSDEGGGEIAGENGALVNEHGGFSFGVSGGGSAQMCASHEAEIHGVDMSAHRTESIAGNAELVAEVTENQRQTSESVLDQAFTGEFASDALGDSLDALPSASPSAVNTNAFAKYDDSVQGESWASEEKGSRAFVGDQIMDRTIAGVPATEQEVVGAFSAATNKKGKGSHDRKKGEQRYFDPIKYHCHFCPWVNGNVASAGDIGGGFVVALSGWQLTLDALYAFQMEEQTSTLPMESESAASMHKSDRSARRIPGSKLKAAKHVFHT